MSIKVSIPEMTTSLSITFTPPTTGSLTLHRTVHNVHYSCRGQNVACACDFDWPLDTVYSSSYGTSHHTSVVTSTGFITNVGEYKTRAVNLCAKAFEVGFLSHPLSATLMRKLCLNLRHDQEV